MKKTILSIAASVGLFMAAPVTVARQDNTDVLIANALRAVMARVAPKPTPVVVQPPTPVVERVEAPKPAPVVAQVGYRSYPFSNQRAVNLVNKMINTPYGNQAFKFWNDRYGSKVASQAMIIMYGEAGGSATDIGRNKNGTIDTGLFQINSIHCYRVPKWSKLPCSTALKNPAINLEVAREVYSEKSNSWRPWSAKCSSKVIRAIGVCVTDLK